MRISRTAALTVSCTLVLCALAAGETSPSLVWRMEIEAPVAPGAELAALTLYPQLLEHVRYLEITPAGNPSFAVPWRLEDAAGTVLSDSYSIAHEPLAPASDLFLVFPLMDGVYDYNVSALDADTPPKLAMPPPPDIQVRDGVSVEYYEAPSNEDFRVRKNWQANEQNFLKLVENTRPFASARLPHPWTLLPPEGRPDYFVAKLLGRIILPVSGRYYFGVDSDDESLITVNQNKTGLSAVKRQIGMFAAAPAGAATGEFAFGAADFAAWFRDETGAQGLVVFWQPPFATGPSILPTWTFRKYPEARVTKYSPGTGTPGLYIGSLEIGAFNTHTSPGEARKIPLFMISQVGPQGPPPAGAYTAMLDDRTVAGQTATAGLLLIVDNSTGSTVAARKLASWHELDPDRYPWAPPNLNDPLIVRISTVLSAAAVYPGEEVSVCRYRELLSRPQFDRRHLPLTCTSRCTTLLQNGTVTRLKRGSLYATLENTDVFTAWNDVVELTDELDAAGCLVHRTRLLMLPLEDPAFPPVLTVSERRLQDPDGTIIVPVLRRITPAERRRWYPVRKARQAVASIDRLDIASTLPAAETASEWPYDPPDGLEKLLIAGEEGSPITLLELACALLNRRSDSGNASAGLLLSLGSADETSGLSEYAYRRILALALHAARRCAYRRILVTARGRYAAAVKEVSAEFQVSFSTPAE
ncbi:MAG: hypothetical protein JW909_01400 [Planctomycetes bacterium]|nr:hypothetical protein [Planctomycetota bacterium]